MGRQKILIVEDDSSILTGLAYALEKEEYLGNRDFVPLTRILCLSIIELT